MIRLGNVEHGTRPIFIFPVVFKMSGKLSCAKAKLDLYLKQKISSINRGIKNESRPICYIIYNNIRQCMTTPENYCTRTAQSSHVSCSRRVHRIENLAVNKQIKVIFLVNFLLLKILIENYYHL